HAGGEVAAGTAEDHHRAAGHVLTAVVADTLDHRRHAAVPHAEALAGEPAEKHLAAGGAVERHVADDDVVLGLEGRAAARIDDHPPAGEALAEVIVGVAFALDRHALRQPGTEALPGGPGELDADGLGGEALRTVAARHLGRQHRAHGPVHVADR